MSKPESLRARSAYGRMNDDIRQVILEGTLKEGDRISGEVALGEEYGISVTSVRRGIDKLVKEGLLRRRQGSGTYVTGTHRAPPSAPILKRDTVAIMSHVRPLTYHPYYSERAAGLRAGLSQFGWKVWEPEGPADSTPNTADFGPHVYSWDRGQMWNDLDQHPEFAGVVIQSSLLPKNQPEWRPPFPMVSPDDTALIPSVHYSWKLEVERAFNIVLAAQPKRIWTLGVFPEAMIQGAFEQAVRAQGVSKPAMTHCRTSDQVRSQSESVRKAYESALEALKELPDAVLVTSDFEAQGVIDAILSLGVEVPPEFTFVALANKESRLQAPWPITRIVSDGYQHGRLLASLMHRQIVEPARAPKHIILSGITEHD